MISNQDVKNGKPDPEMYIKAMKNLNVTPDECLILEDNENGIQAALASGGHLMKIGLPSEVTYENINSRIKKINLG